jgi:histidyl-tRNA synthetase
MRDVLPHDVAVQAAVAGSIERVIEGYGYLEVDLPIIEHRDLYLRKLGEELVGKVYEFSFGGRELALRPEWTASVLRAYVVRMQDQPLPLRLRYSGPVFRYERPQRLTYRQFTQSGVELIGGPAPRADAECIGMACEALRAAGVASYHVRVGHIGLIRAVLGALGLTERTQGLLVWSMERMRTHGVDAVRARLDSANAGLPFDARMIEGIDDAKAEALLLHALREIGVNLRFGTRPPEEIVGRLVRKLRRDDPQPRIERALALLEELCSIRGRADIVLPQVAALLCEHDLPLAPLEELQAILDLSIAHGVEPDRLELDLGLGRGLHYYTGVIFEIYADDDVQLCGGGRYDDLVTTLGGRQPTPAVGFAYGMERVVAAATPVVAARAPAVLVAASDDESYPYAVEVARALRAAGYVAAADVRGRSLGANLRTAARRDVRFVAIVGPQERAQRELIWRDRGGRDDRRISLDALPAPEGED